MPGTIKVGYLLFMICVAFIASSPAQDSTSTPVMPVPATVQYGAGWFPIDASLRISIKGNGDSRVSGAVSRFLHNLSSRTGIPLRDSSDKTNSKFLITCAASGEKVQSLGEDESYRLQITPATVQLDAPNPLGILRGLQTFLQLVRLGPNGFVAPAVSI